MSLPIREVVHVYHFEVIECNMNLRANSNIGQHITDNSVLIMFYNINRTWDVTLNKIYVM